MNQTCRGFDLDELTRRLAILFYNMCVISNELHDNKLQSATSKAVFGKRGLLQCLALFHNQELACCKSLHMTLQCEHLCSK